MQNLVEAKINQLIKKNGTKHQAKKPTVPEEGEKS
jgi:hypothetical protein|tara:strand:- start:1518 stop:1622 length:105 start_codon:yes stop_codon:yes gene_type:complete